MLTVKVTIDRSDNMVTVSTNKGRKWQFFCVDKAMKLDSDTACVASVATSMLMATINSHLQLSSAERLSYTLTVDPNPLEYMKF